MTAPVPVATAAAAPQNCPDYCTSPHGRYDVCQGPTSTVATPPRHIYPGVTEQHIVTALIQDFGILPDETEGTVDPQVSFATSGDCLDLKDPAEVMALADQFAAFADRLRNLGAQLATLRREAGA